jgi:hypothetical protein
LQIGDCLAQYPNYLAYFNQLVGPDHGYKHLVDSNLDWGQDLPALSRWLEQREHHDPVYVYYYGAGEPRFYGIHSPQLTELLWTTITPERLIPLRGGVYCISATAVAGNNELMPRWQGPHENSYRSLLQQAYQLRGMAVQESPQWHKMRNALAVLEVLRLLAYLRQREPDELINYSILVYRLSDADVQRALTGPIHEAPVPDEASMADRWISIGSSTRRPPGSGR